MHVYDGRNKSKRIWRPNGSYILRNTSKTFVSNFIPHGKKYCRIAMRRGKHGIPWKSMVYKFTFNFSWSLIKKMVFNYLRFNSRNTVFLSFYSCCTEVILFVVSHFFLHFLDAIHTYSGNTGHFFPYYTANVI